MKKLYKNKTFYYLLLFLIGIIFGLIFIFFISNLDKYLIKSGLTEYIASITSKTFSYKEGLLLSIKSNLIYVTLIWLCGMIFIFVPVILFIIFYKGFILGFMISSFLITYKIKGIFYSILFIFPHEIINIFIILLFSIYAIKFSKSLIKIIYKNENVNLRSMLKKYCILYIFFIGVSIISSILEIFLNYFLIRIIL